MDKVRFVKSLELQESYAAELGAPILATDGKAEAFVCDGSLTSFVADLSGQQKEDVLHSSLLAQLAANKKHDRFKDTENWYKFYTDVMGHVGWVMQGFNFSEYTSHQAEFKISQVTLELLSGLIGGDAALMAVVKGTLDSLAKSADGITLFGSTSSSSKQGNFQVVPCTVDKSNQVNVAFLGSYFEASEVAHNYFFVTMKKQDVHLFKATQVFTLDGEIYDQVRDAVLEKLGDSGKKFIKKLPDISWLVIYFWTLWFAI